MTFYKIKKHLKFNTLEKLYVILSIEKNCNTFGK